MRTKEILAKTIIVPSKLPCTDYVVNPYVGCSFACGYCYASFMGRFVGEPVEAWGDYVYVKINTVALFEREIERLHRRAPHATLMMSSVTDAWQGPEKKHRLARGVLAVLAARRYCGLVSLLTKSPLVLRDLDLIQALPNRELGVTVTSPDDAIGRELEARAPAMRQRFEILQRRQSSIFFPCVVQIHEPVLAETFQANAGVESFRASIVERLIGTAEVQRGAVGVGPEIKFLRRERATLVDPDRMWQ